MPHPLARLVRLQSYLLIGYRGLSDVVVTRKVLSCRIFEMSYKVPRLCCMMNTLDGQQNISTPNNTLEMEAEIAPTGLLKVHNNQA